MDTLFQKTHRFPQEIRHESAVSAAGLRRFGIASILPALLMFGQPAYSTDNIAAPHSYLRTSTNLLSNPSFTGGRSGWNVYASTGVEYDSTVTHSGTSGSIKFDQSGAASGMLIGPSLTTFSYDTPYTFSFRVKFGETPAYVNIAVNAYNSSNALVSETPVTLAANTPGANAASPSEWQEVSLPFRISDHTVTRLEVRVSRGVAPAYTAPIYVDDMYLGEDISFAEAPSQYRKPFNGAKVKVDPLGNWSVKEDGEWHDFFPFGISPDLARTDYTILGEAGFNIVAYQQYPSQVLKAKEAGMYASLRLGKYMTNDPHFQLANPLSLPLVTVLSDIVGDILDPLNGLADTLLFYDWDNENNWTQPWSTWQDVATEVRSLDTARPIYVLNSYAAVQRQFSDLSDVSGTYVGTKQQTGFGKFETLLNLQASTVPASIAQINDVENTSYGFRLRVYDALIKGARGIMYFGDHFTHVDTLNWWDDVPILAAEVAAIRPILRQPYWTTWNATTNNAAVLIGSRDWEGDGYLLVANTGPTAEVTFTLDGLEATDVLYAFLNYPITEVEDGQFTLEMEGYSTLVLRLVNETP